METIYQAKFWTDTMDEAKERASESEPALQKVISEHPFFSEFSAESTADFSELARLCQELAAHEDAEFELAVNHEEHTATIALCAPCFLFQIRQMILWQKITLWASEIIFDVTENTNSKIIVSFDFTKANEILHRQIQNKIFQL